MEKAYAEARSAVLKAPNCAQTHGILAFVMNNTGNPIIAERHIQITKMLGGNTAHADIQLGRSFINRGMLKAAENAFMASFHADPNNVQAYIGLAEAYEKQGDRVRAEGLAQTAFEMNPKAPMVTMIYGKILAAMGLPDKALSVMSDTLDIGALFERGKIKEKMGDYIGAFNDYSNGNKLSGKVYNYAEASKRVNNHKTFANKQNLSRIPKINGTGKGEWSPIFITGYPRSGTTLFETILSNHTDIQPGDELNFINHIAGMSQAWLGASDMYPFSLNDTIIGDKNAVLAAFRSFYTAKCMPIVDTEKQFLTDKMPLNEMHLPLISIIFNEAPIFYVRRNPLDIIISNFATYLEHGFYQAFELNSCATHYALVDDLVLHYRSKVDMNFAEIRYEDMIAEPEKEIREAIDFIGLPFDARCLAPETNTRHARTPSYEAVKQPINDSSVGRWRHFEMFMGDAMKIVEPILIREGY